MVFYDIPTHEFIIEDDEPAVLKLPEGRRRWKFEEAAELLGYCVATRFRLNIHDGQQIDGILPGDQAARQDVETMLKCETGIRRWIQYQAPDKLQKIESQADDFAAELLYPTERLQDK